MNAPLFGIRPDPAEVLLPEVIAARCVHTRIEQASCRACVDACPTAAWVIDDERLGIDAARCDGCGLCAPACPQGAIAQRYAPLRAQLDGQGSAFAACSRACNWTGDTGIDQGALLPCVHVLGLNALLGLYRQGVRRLLLCTGACDRCPRGAVTRIQSRCEQVSALLVDRGLAPLRYLEQSVSDFARGLAAARLESAGMALRSGLDARLGRRAFLGGWIKAAADRAVEWAERDDGDWPGFVPPGRLLPSAGAVISDLDSPPRASCDRLSLHAPAIDARRCTGCDACARVCPHQVIRVEPTAYRMDPDGCTGCRMCADICAAGAMSVRKLAVHPQTLLPLRQARCAACGVAFHVPWARSAPSARTCPICASTRHREQLFQVIAPEVEPATGSESGLRPASVASPAIEPGIGPAIELARPPTRRVSAAPQSPGLPSPAPASAPRGSAT